MTHLERGKRLRVAVEERRALLAPGAANALTARIAEDLGYETVYITGAGIANTGYGVPDIGLTTVTEVANTVAAISDCCDLPLIVDADTGFGNPLNMIRTVRLLERAGANALQIEDQQFPKRCGHFAGKSVISRAEMCEKVKAAVDSRSTEDLLIIARTDACAIEGLDAALDRAAAYIEAGADITFVEAPTSEAQLREIVKRLAAPQVINLVIGGKTPLLSQTVLREIGFSLVLYANAALQASIVAIRDVLSGIRAEGGAETVLHRLATFEDRQNVVRKSYWDGLERRYVDEPGAPG
ncbi:MULTISPECIES: isocitrate lyase/phosphoenolpyruvate mutase family protein [unclassified Chelatococcus]|uniref:isocitrate lyase/PEP mutase family protein n=1 Tax=unclassified Chelatococcus TaxID=2638111 RepID=UPI001BCE5A53|nr:MULTISPECIES: isocitrate lyase/phosphoenolpyruvate mutase family protein [unclassified Chelatococcus]CAH1649547.1 putative carboxyvinyl-carboxyphosphonate phosphorylmutase [Hyphomicrobiales bacterium]MBS7741749.1 isocitrate lyase/phosphoenolpyruvate mutase family protein [Chelatococcus sp. HY11]MBX3541453.1 isocitrate lyase/phosphoenolpyruvate mutase family protein [Chelatococcus sp.]MCO5074653.1 isocitrate lyase/phosphoenolpyruvate mutase family protein [Chelatococcus sp.]CAH1692027.1 puta